MVKLRGDNMVVIMADSLTGIPLFDFHFTFYILHFSGQSEREHHEGFTPRSQLRASRWSR